MCGTLSLAKQLQSSLKHLVLSLAVNFLDSLFVALYCFLVPLHLLFMETNFILQTFFQLLQLLLLLLIEKLLLPASFQPAESTPSVTNWTSTTTPFSSSTPKVTQLTRIRPAWVYPGWRNYYCRILFSYVICRLSFLYGELFWKP